jgi:hypothetical protein
MSNPFAWLGRSCAVALSGLLLAGCAQVQVSQYAQQQPKLDVRQYFSGTVDAWGQFQKRDGEVVKRFKVVIESNWVGNVGTLDERFVYSDGTTQRRVWTLTDHGNGRITGTADDVVGQAEGQQAGNALNWKYTMRLPVDGTEYQVQFDDWMYLMDGDTMLNRASMSKFGFELGQVTLFFRKRPATQP